MKEHITSIEGHSGMWRACCTCKDAWIGKFNWVRQQVTDHLIEAAKQEVSRFTGFDGIPDWDELAQTKADLQYARERLKAQEGINAALRASVALTENRANEYEEKYNVFKKKAEYYLRQVEIRAGYVGIHTVDVIDMLKVLLK